MSSDASSAPASFGACPIPITETDCILLGHGSGGRLTGELIEKLIVPTFRNPFLELLDDQAVLPIPTAQNGSRAVSDFDSPRLAFTTDSYVITPIFFPGGDIGDLAVNGTINDLVVGGARPIALSFALILEEGLPIADLRRVLESARRAAAKAGVPIVTGDTKVVERGKGDQIFINTAGVGIVPPGVHLSSSRVRSGDAIIVSGTVGDHGMAIFASRKGIDFGGDLQSDTAALDGLASAILTACPSVHAMRDPTRGGLAATLVEMASRQKLGVEIDERSIPVRDSVRGACELLGLDPLLIANEGKLVAFVPEEGAPAALAAMRTHPLGREAVRIGTVTAMHPGRVVVRTMIGGNRILDLPFAEPLPRIC